MRKKPTALEKSKTKINDSIINYGRALITPNSGWTLGELKPSVYRILELSEQSHSNNQNKLLPPIK